MSTILLLLVVITEHGWGVGGAVGFNYKEGLTKPEEQSANRPASQLSALVLMKARQLLPSRQACLEHAAQLKAGLQPRFRCLSCCFADVRTVPAISRHSAVGYVYVTIGWKNRGNVKLRLKITTISAGW